MDAVHKRTYTSLRIHALRNMGFISARELRRLRLPTTEAVLEKILLELEEQGLLKVIERVAQDQMYDFLPFLEKTVEESVLDMATRFQLAHIYLERKMWNHAIAALRMTQMHPKFRKESLFLLGKSFEKKGAYEKARENYERVLAIDYYYQDVRERLTRLVQQQEKQTVGAQGPRTTAVSIQQQVKDRLPERYEIVQELGRGGAGVVFHALDLNLKRDVALKILYQQVTQQDDRVFNVLQEARLAAQLDHPNLIDIYDVNVESRFIAMEFVDGGTLRDILTKYKRLTLPQARALLMQLCRGLHVAHQAGVLHRDIKPANIFITRRKHIKLGDFGIAHIKQVQQDTFTQISAQIGTLPYMSPEQVRGGALQATSDIYALGILFYEILTGAPPFLRGDIAYHHLYTTPPPPRCAPEIDAVILRCLEKDPAQRFQSVEALLQTLKLLEYHEGQRLNQYRELLKMALIDKELAPGELLVLKMKRKALKLSLEEAHRVERELGVQIPD